MGHRAARAGGKTARQFGQLLARLRGDRPLAEVVEHVRKGRVQISQSALSRYETEGRIPDLLMLAGLARALKVPFDGLTNALRHELTTASAVSVDELENIARDPARQTRTGRSDDDHGTPAAQARLLEELRQRHAADLADARQAAFALARIVERERETEDRHTRIGKADSHKRDRTTG